MSALLSSNLHLTSTGRLARRLHHIYRMTNLRNEKRGWESLSCFSLNDWLRDQWADLWSEHSPSHPLQRLRLWLELTEAEPPPGDLLVDIPLCRVLDDTYETLVRHGLDPSMGPASSPLVEWRKKISGLFKDRLYSSGYFHPSELPFLISRCIRDGLIRCPDTIVLTGFDAPAPAEMELFRVFNERSRLTFRDRPDGEPDRLEALALPSREQEVHYLIHRLIEDAQTVPLHRIGVVVPDLDLYADLLRSFFESVAGPRPATRSSGFNLSLGQRLNSFSLIRASMLPLRMLQDGEDRDSLFSLFLSPYFRWGAAHRIARADLLWREAQIESGVIPLLGCLKERAPETLEEIASEKLQSLLHFCRMDLYAKRPIASWIRDIEGLWSTLEFPVIADEADSVAHNHLTEIFDGMNHHLSGLLMTGRDFLSWFDHTTASVVSQTAGSEEAGIQILGLIESRGHDFDHLYVVGLIDGSLPQPVRPLPFLDVSERKRVQGGTAESQYDFSERAFRRLLSSAPAITLLRPQQCGPDPVTPSPFWPGDEREVFMNLWDNPGRSLIRAPWLKEAFDGLSLYSRFRGNELGAISILGRKSGDDLHPTTFAVPDTFSVSDMEKAVFCLQRFFFDVILKIEPLKATEIALFPAERGRRLHRVFALFTKELRKKGLSPDGDKDALRALLAACADHALEDVICHPRWMVERRFWLEEGGLLQRWLDLESDHCREGWRVTAEEAIFDSLVLQGWRATIKGRMDRIDAHPSLGILCLDYKTGTPPSKRDILSRHTAPQLPLYLLALQKDTVIGHLMPEGNPPLSAGYVRVKSQTDSAMVILGGADFSWTDHLRHWEDLFYRTGHLLDEAGFTARPFPFSLVDNRDAFCARCPCLTLCERGLIPDVLEEAEDADEDETS